MLRCVPVMVLKGVGRKFCVLLRLRVACASVLWSAACVVLRAAAAGGRVITVIASSRNSHQ